MTDLLLHTCCGPCSTVAVPAWRERGVEPVGWFENPNIQPAAELERRRESMLRYGRAAGLELVAPEGEGEAPGCGAAGTRSWLTPRPRSGARRAWVCAWTQPGRPPELSASAASRPR